MNPYTILGVQEDASDDAIKTAYRRAAAANHPDREGGNEEKMAEINKAYQILGDPDLRQRYDETGATGMEETFEERLTREFLNLASTLLGKKGNLVANMAAELARTKAAFQKELADVTKEKEALLRKKGKIASRTPKNLLAELIDAKVAELDRLAGRGEEHLKVVEGLEKMLQDYTDQEVEVPTSTTGYQGAFASADQIEDLLTQFFAQGSRR